MYSGNDNDLRVKKTHLAIRNAFLELLSEYDYDKITVTMLCERAMINRKTFYAHYAYMDELMAEYMSDLADEFMKEIGIIEGIENLPKRIRRFILYLPKVDPIIERIVMSSQGINFFYQVGSQILDKIPQKTEGMEKVEQNKRRIILDYLNYSCLVVYRGWLRGGKQIGIEELADLAGTLICGDINSLLEYIGMS